MAVYVDDQRHPFGRMLMCHMAADSSDELHAFARAIGVARRWVQYPGTYREHFDICQEKRALAVRLGAQQVTQRQLVEKMLARRTVSSPAAPGATPASGAPHTSEDTGTV